MKKELLSVFSGLLFSGILVAQSPTLTRENMMSYGSVTSMADVSDATISIIDITKTGINQVWDFSLIENKDESTSYTSTIERPVDTPYGANYPQSNYVMTEKTFFGGEPTNTVHNYYLLNNTKLERLGSVNTLTPTAGSIYTDPQTEYVFPTTYGTTNSDTWKSSSSTFGGTADLDCIGYGTLKLPNATYQNVLMVHLVIDDFMVIDTHAWFSENGVLLLAHYDLDYILGNDISAKYATDIDLHLSNTPTALNIITANAKNIQYNNPAQQTLELKMEIGEVSELNLSVINSLGTTVFTTKQSVSPTTTNTISIDVNSLNPGIYFLSVSSDSSTKPEVIKFIKQ